MMTPAEYHEHFREIEFRRTPEYPMIDQLAYKDFMDRFTFHLRRNCSEITVRRALGIMAAGERRYGDCAFAVNHEVFMAADFEELARDARAKAHLYDALAAVQREYLAD